MKEKSDFFFYKNNVCKASEQEECTLLVCYRHVCEVGYNFLRKVTKIVLSPEVTIRFDQVSFWFFSELDPLQNVGFFPQL